MEMVHQITSNGDGNPEDAMDSDGDGVPDFIEINNPIITDDVVEVFNTISPNGDNINDVLIIQGIEDTSGNVLTIYNRWGVEVFAVSDYGVDDNFFRGFSNGRTTIGGDDELPTGTYYYVFEYTINATGVSETKAGYLYIN